MGDWIICPDCDGSGFTDAVFVYSGSSKAEYVEPCYHCRGVKEIYVER